MALSDHTKIAFVRGLGTSACYLDILDINARTIDGPQLYGLWSPRVEYPLASRFSPWGREVETESA
jgi:hypothetical protein